MKTLQLPQVNGENASAGDPFLVIALSSLKRRKPRLEEFRNYLETSLLERDDPEAERLERVLEALARVDERILSDHELWDLFERLAWAAHLTLGFANLLILINFAIFPKGPKWLKYLLRRCFGVVLGVKPLLRKYQGTLRVWEFWKTPGRLFWAFWRGKSEERRWGLSALTAEDWSPWVLGLSRPIGWMPCGWLGDKPHSISLLSQWDSTQALLQVAGSALRFSAKCVHLAPSALPAQVQATGTGAGAEEEAEGAGKEEKIPEAIRCDEALGAGASDRNEVEIWIWGGEKSLAQLPEKFFETENWDLGINHWLGFQDKKQWQVPWQMSLAPVCYLDPSCCF